MKTAYVLMQVRPLMPFVVQGLARHGFRISESRPTSAQPGDVLAIWNRMRGEEPVADQFEKSGGTVLVFENGYLGELESQLTGQPPYAIARHGHNGSGTWYVGTENRFKQLGIELRDWKTDGKQVLICPNRGIGSNLMRMPSDWPKRCFDVLKRWVNVESIYVRPHPGNWRKRPSRTPLQHDLARARVCVIWSSSAGVQALIEGVPVIYCAPHWICSDAASSRLERVNDPYVYDRSAALHRMAWAQWTRDEITAGIPFDYLLNGH